MTAPRMAGQGALPVTGPVGDMPECLGCSGQEAVRRRAIPPQRIAGVWCWVTAWACYGCGLDWDERDQ